MFEAISAVCVTGLVVTDTAMTFTAFGECVLMVLIQVGGLGFMTLGILVAMFLGKKIGLSERLLSQNALKYFNLSGVVKLVKIVIAETMIIEGIGALLLALVWAPEIGLGDLTLWGTIVV